MVIRMKTGLIEVKLLKAKNHRVDPSSSSSTFKIKVEILKTSSSPLEAI